MPIDDRRVTLKDIAEKTGFTVNTVSQALRGSPKLREETKAAIRAAAKELGYVHNALAGSLRSGSSRTIAIIVGDTSNLRFSIQLHAFELAFRTLGYQVIVMNTDETAQYELDAVKNAVRSSVDGVLLCPCQKSRAAIDLLTSHHHAKNAQFRYEVDNRCLGAYVLNEESGEPETILADWTVLATGGVGQVFLHSTNAPGCVGTGVSMAFRAGVDLANLEFMQFHPTALYEERSNRRPLITEAMRGEGARLLDEKGRAFMLRHDKRGDLAPRDVVAQAMMEEMLHSGAPCLFLDVSGVKQDLPTRFPTVFEQCREAGLDIRKEPIPVVPAAHYFCGGVLTDTRGRTSMRGLYAIGECACTGLHGANRLASTSLLEALVWGVSCGKDLARRAASGGMPTGLAAAIPDWQHEGDERHDDPALVAQDWANIRNTMWNYVGISRTDARLRRAFEDMRDLVRHIHDFYKRTRISRRLVDLFHGSQTAYVITQAAMRNPVSLGCHHRVD